MLFTVPSTGGFKNNPYKKIRETRKLRSFYEYRSEEQKIRVENQTKT